MYLFNIMPKLLVLQSTIPKNLRHQKIYEVGFVTGLYLSHAQTINSVISSKQKQFYIHESTQ